MKAKELIKLGIPPGEAVEKAIALLAGVSANKVEVRKMKKTIKTLVQDPGSYVDDPHLGELAHLVAAARQRPVEPAASREPIEYRLYGHDIEQGALQQMENACRLPISVAGALMPDAHQGYGLPIGGVLATAGAVIPFAVGMDIACRMKMTVLELPTAALYDDDKRLIDALNRETMFGVGASFKKHRQHPVMDEDWSFSKLTQHLKDKAAAQLGTSGSGNHFVEYGQLTVTEAGVGLPEGKYLALLSHSGSRGTGGDIATHFSKLAKRMHPEIDPRLHHLAWLGLDTEEGQEYWQAMELMGRYAAANHYLIHHFIAKALNVRVLLDIENHHNFAWKEMRDGREVIVHRKGATPAHEGVLGIIPGSMATPGFVIRGKGEPESIYSASHGAGRLFSRKKAKENFRWKEAKEFLKKNKVHLLSAGLDEVPMAYKDIEQVMADQAELVQILARFDPRIVKMAGPSVPGER